MPYRWGKVEGLVRAKVGVNDDPAAFGCGEIARGFPYLTASVDSAGVGYQHLGGWLQLVDYSDREGGFEIDQYPPIEDISHPFCFFGHSPAFFDCPHSDDAEDWNFLANTFFCGFGGELLEFRHEVRAILGFSWGFSKRGRQVEGFGPAPLSPREWDGHRAFLAQEYGKWEFAPGFVQDPLRP
jgi:hypothetical protein